ncbi:hypothetical protein FXE34_11855 [Vibrio cholerae]|nr:hypothetical protein FXF14_17395 [Vibrio cholerae]TYA07228.1 hypothetical protein FXE34_11855 [Vibrio cholerae]
MHRTYIIENLNNSHIKCKAFSFAFIDTFIAWIKRALQGEVERSEKVNLYSNYLELQVGNKRVNPHEHR